MTHKIFNNKNAFLINYLEKILKCKKISHNRSELLSYTNSQLKFLINKYRLKYNNIDKKTNSWYITNF